MGLLPVVRHLNSLTVVYCFSLNPLKKFSLLCSFEHEICVNIGLGVSTILRNVVCSEKTDEGG